MEILHPPAYLVTGTILGETIKETQCICGISAIQVYAVGRDSSVGITTGYGLVGPGIESRWGARFFAYVQTGPGAHPAFCTMGTGSFPGVKRPGRGADHPPPSSAEVRKE
jgi:hypothetical protein